MNNTFQLLKRPEALEYEAYNWFEEECYLIQGFDEHYHFSSIYFIPQHRIEEVANNPQDNLLEEQEQY